MIGLGSNRLSVCRRGGMSVTQAGRGGMEWLAGGRMPSWASPYSAQATAALKAQFPTQWPTIRDYGFAHPEIVGYMNAYAPEDAKIAYSLVEGIGTRGLSNNGSTYADTGYKIRNNSDFRFKFKVPYVANTSVIGAESGGCCIVVQFTWGGSNHLQLKDQRGTNWELGPDGATKDIERVGLKCYLNGEYILDTTQSDTLANNSVYIGWGHGGNFTGKCLNTTYLAFFQDENLSWHRYIPFKRNNELGWLDLETGNMATNYGTFTELIESPAS